MHSHNEVNTEPNPFRDAEAQLYAAGNPHVAVQAGGPLYAAIPAESAYTELDREHSRLTARLGVLRGELAEARADLKTARSRAWWLGVVVGLYTAGGLLAVGVYLLR